MLKLPGTELPSAGEMLEKLSKGGIDEAEI